MKTSDMLIVAGLALASYAIFDITRISDRFYLSDAENARINLNIARGWGLITPAAAAAYFGALAAGTVTAKQVTLGLIEMERTAV